MNSESARSSLDKLVTESREERAHVRHLVASGNWQSAEQDVERSKAYATRLQKNLSVVSSSRAEALIGDTVDYQPVNFLVKGARSRRAVGFVEVNTPRISEVASGFLISPRLFITNQHVIRDISTAHSATVTFDREMDEHGRPSATTTFRFAPDICAIFSDEKVLDYALIAIGDRISGNELISNLGFCILSDEPNKHAVGMNVNIVQHPNGWQKTVALRNNLLTHRTDCTLLYETDTQPGSSGAPVFNDNWDLVALHHYGAPFLERTDDSGKSLPQTINEGVRISAIVRDLQSRLEEMPPSFRRLIEEALSLSTIPTISAMGGRTLGPPRPVAHENKLIPVTNSKSDTISSTLPTRSDFESSRNPSQLEKTSSDSFINNGVIMSTTENIQTRTAIHHDGTVKITLPLEISIRIGGTEIPLRQVVLGSNEISVAPKVLTRASEALKIDENYVNRTGYDENFIEGVALPLPKMSATLKAGVAPLRGNDAAAVNGVLNYEHFSLILHKSRRIGIFTATNIDGVTYLSVDRKTGQVGEAESEKWFKDPRVSDAYTLNQEFYSAWSTYFDRGHLTRRTDPTWGSAETAERANGDTFHFSNCSPQHFRFNQTAKFWQGAERYVLENGVLAAGNANRISVIQGPIFNDVIDLWADDVQIPSSFFKIIVWKGADRLKAVGLIVDQLPLLSESRVALKPPEQLVGVKVSQWRVSIKMIEEKTGLDFGQAIRDSDTIESTGQPTVGAEKAVLLSDLRELLA